MSLHNFEDQICDFLEHIKYLLQAVTKDLLAQNGRNDQQTLVGQSDKSNLKKDKTSSLISDFFFVSCTAHVVTKVALAFTIGTRLSATAPQLLRPI